MTILIYFIQCISLVFPLKAALKTFLFISELYMFAKYSRVHLLILIKVSYVLKKLKLPRTRVIFHSRFTNVIGTTIRHICLITLRYLEPNFVWCFSLVERRNVKPRRSKMVKNEDWKSSKATTWKIDLSQQSILMGKRGTSWNYRPCSNLMT